MKFLMEQDPKSTKLLHVNYFNDKYADVGVMSNKLTVS